MPGPVITGTGQWANVPITLAAETAAIISEQVTVGKDAAIAFILAWGQLTIGAACTSVTARIRRGAGLAGALISEENPELVKGAVGSTEPFFMFAAENIRRTDTVRYTLTLQQIAATADGAFLQGGILVIIP